MQQVNRHCRQCDRPTLHARPGANHVLHFLITAFTLGLWLPVWLLMALPVGYWRCQACGTAHRMMPAPLRWLLIAAIPVVALIAFTLFAVMTA